MWRMQLSNFKSVAFFSAMFLVLVGCGHPNDNSSSSSNILEARRNLTIAQWFSKQGLSPAEIITVDAILESIVSMGGPANNPAAAAVFAERKLDSLSLDGRGISEIGPILAIKGIAHMSISQNNLTQAQFDELLAGLPNLRTLLVDPNIVCRKELNPRVTCLK